MFRALHAYRPRSAILPSLMTRIWSAPIIVDSLLYTNTQLSVKVTVSYEIKQHNTVQIQFTCERLQLLSYWHTLWPVRLGCCVLFVCLVQMWPAEKPWMLHGEHSSNSGHLNWKIKNKATDSTMREWQLRCCRVVSSHLIQQDDLWGFQNGPGNSYPLFLSST